MIRNATPTDASDICAIYNFHVLNTTVTFEEEPVTIEEIKRRITHITQNHPWIVYVYNDSVVAYAYASLWKPRSAYRYTAESTIYVAEGYGRKGIGKALYTRLMQDLEKLGVHSVIGGIAQPNDASVRLHESMGFEKIGQFSEVGLKFGKWVDVGYWQHILGKSSQF